MNESIHPSLGCEHGILCKKNQPEVVGFSNQNDMSTRVDTVLSDLHGLLDLRQDHVIIEAVKNCQIKRKVAQVLG